MLRHPTDFVSLAFGLIFVAVGVVLAVERLDAISLAWIAPVTAIVIGALLVVAGRSARPGAENEASETEKV
jgi:hypothetical protein